MLKTLDIKDYAIIEHLRIDLKDGFCVMTGETGAGKSIIMGALGMVMGEKAEAKSVRNGAKKSVVEAVFAIKEYDLKDYFDENDLDYDDECTIRREVTENGKSRAFVNDTPITLSDLKNLGEKLIDIHSQHANLLLKKDSFQLKVIDTIAKDEKELSEYKSAYKAYKDTEKELRQKKEELEKKAFILGGENYNAPIQTVGDFLNNRKTTEFGIVKPTYVGTPQGGNLSPLLSNIMLNELDKEIKESYMEDNV